MYKASVSGRRAMLFALGVLGICHARRALTGVLLAALVWIVHLTDTY